MHASDFLYAGTIFLLKLLLVVVCSPFIGCLGLAAIPVRFWQASNGVLKASAAKLSSPAKILAFGGIAFVFAATIVWVGTLYAIFENATCGGAGCALGGLGIFLVICLLGSVYGLAELLLYPATFPE